MGLPITQGVYMEYPMAFMVQVAMMIVITILNPVESLVCATTTMPIIIKGGELWEQEQQLQRVI